MLVLGIECTAHTFGVGIVDAEKREVLFNEKKVFSDEVAGMDPRKLLEFHVLNFDSVLLEARSFLKEKGLSFSDLDLIAFSRGPGQGHSLKVAALVAKSLALKYELKIVGVNHIRAHLEIGKMVTGFEDPLFLNITGVNSQVIAKDVSGVLRVYGETEDIGLGNLLDTCARELGLGFPGGPKIEEFAKNGKNYIDVPYTIKGMNVSFAGLNSFVKQQIEKFREGKKIFLANGVEIVYEKWEDFVCDLCYSLQETVFAMILEVAERAVAYTQKNKLVLVGGVAANKRFVEMAKNMCGGRGIEYDSTPLSLCMDNGAMIAWLGFVDRDRASYSIENLKPMPYLNLEGEF